MKIVNIKNKKATRLAIKAIKKGGIIVCPTDTVYGLIADATNKKAVGEIFKIKKRPKSKPLAVFVKDIKAAKELAEIDINQEKILKKYWPGKYTFILKSQIPMSNAQSNPKSQILNSKLLTKNRTIALRIPKYKFLNDLLKKINKPLAQTSANISGKPASTKIEEVLSQFKKKKTTPNVVPNFPMLIIDGGNLLKSKPSKVIDLTGKKRRVLRY